MNFLCKFCSARSEVGARAAESLILVAAAWRGHCDRHRGRHVGGLAAEEAAGAAVDGTAGSSEASSQCCRAALDAAGEERAVHLRRQPRQDRDGDDDEEFGRRHQAPGAASGVGNETAEDGFPRPRQIARELLFIGTAAVSNFDTIPHIAINVLLPYIHPLPPHILLYVGLHDTYFLYLVRALPI